MKILIMKFRHFGDVLLTSPMASALATLPNKPQVTFLVKQGTEVMLSGHPDIHAVLTLPVRARGESQWQFIRRQLAFIRTLRAQRFDVSINTTEGDRGLIFGWLSGAAKRVGYLKDASREKWWRKRLLTDSKPSRNGRFHTVLRNLDLITDWVTPTDIRVSFYYSPSDELAVLDKLKQAGWDGNQPLVHVHAVSRWFFKCWRDDYMAQTIDHIQQTLGYRVVLTSAPDPQELDKLAGIITLCQTQPINLGGQLSLKQTGALSALAKLFFGVDSAPMHIAAAVDTPTVAIFGPSGAFDWGPWSNGWADMSVNPYSKRNGIQRVGQHIVVQQTWDCAPCGKDGCNGSKRSDCLENLAPDSIQKQLTALLPVVTNDRKCP